jgi:hypothetical protein
MPKPIEEKGGQQAEPRIDRWKHMIGADQARTILHPFNMKPGYQARADSFGRGVIMVWSLLAMAKACQCATIAAQYYIIVGLVVDVVCVVPSFSFRQRALHGEEARGVS